MYIHTCVYCQLYNDPDLYRLVPAKVVRNWKVMLINGNPLYEEQPVRRTIYTTVCIM